MPARRVVRVLPDVPAIDKAFDYLVPDTLADEVAVGTIVRVALHGRRVRGWVVADSVSPAAEMALRPLTKVTGHGPAPELIDLARWAAWRWAGKTVHFLRTASPSLAVRGLPAPLSQTRLAPSGADEVVVEALHLPRAVLRLSPAADVLPVVLEAARRGTTLVVAPSQAMAASVAQRARHEGVNVALLPRQWPLAAAGARLVVGARAAAWAPAVELAAVIVLDEHDEAHQGEAAPTWNARDVAAERARRADAACVWTSPCPSLEALAWGSLLAPSRTAERAGWPVVDVVDRRGEEPIRKDLYSPRLVDLLRTAAAGSQPGPAPSAAPPLGTAFMVCVLNRKGRASLLACAACAELARCEACGAAVASGDGDTVVCRRCGAVRPALCLSCGTTRLKALRQGVRRAREDLERLSGAPVQEVTADVDVEQGTSGGVERTDVSSAPVPFFGGHGYKSANGEAHPILVGTEAVLHRIAGADVIAFLDLDAELLAPHYRAAEQALALVTRAARVLGGKAGGGRLVLQTRLPRHEVVQAALHADPGRVATVERQRRHALRFPPLTALALVAGARSEAFVKELATRGGVEVLGPGGGTWLVRAPDHATLCDALAAVPRPPGRLRVAVDPRRV
ncbi:MAG: hypothetical protein ACR2G7_02560 [Acidimicrobiales bacterium]